MGLLISGRLKAKIRSNSAAKTLQVILPGTLFGEAALSISH
jgi:hypothetical protein